MGLKNLREWVYAVFFATPLCFCSAAEPMSKAALDRPLVSLTFDDGWSSAYDTVIPLLEWYDFKGTFYLFTDVLGKPNYITNDQVLKIYKAGHEIGAHSIDHADLATLMPSMVEEQLSKPKKILENLIQAPVVNFAAPFGSVSPLVLSLIPKYYKSNRSSFEGFNSKEGFDRYSIKVQMGRANVTPDQVEGWLDLAMKNHLWLVLMYHQVDEGNATYSTTPGNFEKHLKAIQARKIPVVTIKEGLAEVMHQIIEANSE